MAKKYNRNSPDENKELVDFMSSDLADDISLLQQPIATAYDGFNQARRAYDDGTNEVRALLMHECSIIYECNTCRNMFRSLPNFISHKRTFCNGSSIGKSKSNGYADHAAIIARQTCPTTAMKYDTESVKRSRSTGSSPVPTVPNAIKPTTKGSTRNISLVIERLRREQAKDTTSTMLQLHDDTVLQLENVPTSSQAVYQTIKQTDDAKESVRTEIDEVRKLLEESQPVLGPDGKIMKKCISFPDCISCESCPAKFQTEKMLQLHTLKMHNESTYVFQCPSCSETFLKPSAVIRHLSHAHYKSQRCIRRMRESILKRRCQQSEIQPRSGTNRELKRLQITGIAKDATESFEFASDSLKAKSSCTFCHRSFERRAALSTHLVNCPAKQESLKKPATHPTTAKLVTSNGITTSKLTKTKLRKKKKEPVKQIKQEQNISENIPPPQDGIENSSILGNYLNNPKVEPIEDAERESTSNLKTLSIENVSPGESQDSVALEKLPGEPIVIDTSKSPSPTLAKKNKRRSRESTPQEKPAGYRCKICQKEFEGLCNIRRHVSTFHHASERYGCSLCTYRAFRQYDVTNHLLNIHHKERNSAEPLIRFITKKACEFSRNDIEDAIELLNGITETVDIVDISDEAMSPPQTAPLPEKKRKGRHKKREKLATVVDSSDIKLEPTTIKLEDDRVSVTKDAEESSNPVENFEKRPKRIRVKPVDKDFVYDMPSFSNKKDILPAMPALESTRSAKRRHQSICENRTTVTKPQPQSVKQTVAGSARHMMLQAILDGRAMCALDPEPFTLRIKAWKREEMEISVTNRNFTEPPTKDNEKESFVETLLRRTSAIGHNSNKRQKTIDSSTQSAFVSSNLSESMEGLHVTTDENKTSTSSSISMNPIATDYQTTQQSTFLDLVPTNTCLQKSASPDSSASASTLINSELQPMASHSTALSTFVNPQPINEVTLPFTPDALVTGVSLVPLNTV